MLVGLGLVLFLLQPRWPEFERWQAGGGFKTVTGYVLLAAMSAMWLPVWLRKKFKLPHQLALIKLTHQWLGVLALGVFVLHANLARSGFLALMTLLLFTLSGLGAGLAWMQDGQRTAGRRWVMAAHIALGFVVSGFTLVHLYFVYAYAG